MTRFWQRFHRSLTALALFAMLMAFTGPLISQMQRLMEMPAHGGVMIASSHASAHHGMSSADDHRMSSPAPSHSTSSHSASLTANDHWHMAACGYCELFLHAPGIEAPSVVVPISPTPAVFYPPLDASVPAPAPIYPRYAPRAPPQA